MVRSIVALRKTDVPLASDDVRIAGQSGAGRSGADVGLQRVSASAAPRRSAKISTVSHTLEETIAERLRHFAFRQRISESAVIEFALRAFFTEGSDELLGDRLRAAGAALRRRS